MKPLSQNNKKNQIITSLERAIICDVFNRKYAAFLRDRCFDMTYDYDESREQLLVTLILSNDDDSFHYPLETMAFLNDNSSHTVKDTANLLLNYLDEYLECYFDEGEDLYLTIDWQEITWHDLTFYVRAQVRNMMLEKSSEKLLEQHSSQLRFS
ncbi:MAG: hypothetical protein OXC40_06880 [Proteobacteria bacterium]|nr:hypothetical protein [Pseudomonadota bacterium]